MGDVYLAEHTGIQTRVAIKMLQAQISRDADQVQRFFNEARIVGKIKHAGIAKIFDVGFHGERAYLVMELLEGESLAARVHRGRLAMTEAVDIAYQIASVLAATHKAGVVHRDLKPDNIFLVPDEELGRPRVKILDFGIAKLHDKTGPRTIGTMGTPAYMAPEQWGDAGSVDWRADIYSLGCVAFEMVAGRPPFAASTIVEAFKNHTDTPPPSVRTIVDVPEAWDVLVTRLLAKQPAARAESSAAVAHAFDALRVSIDPDAQWTTATNPSTARAATTLGSSASQVVATIPPAPKRSLMFAGIFAALVVVIAATTIIVKGSGGEPSSAAATQPTAPPAAPQPKPEPAKPEPAKPEPAKPEPKHEPAKPEPAVAPITVVEPPGKPKPKAVKPKPAPAPVVKPTAEPPKPAPPKPATNELEDRT